MKICRTCGTRFDDATSFCPRDSEPLYVDHESMVGRRLDGQYEIEAFIAEGGMGAVYRARHTLLGDTVAIKILPAEMRHNAEWLRRFQREGQAARRFRHANAVIVHDLRTSSEGEVYLVMEYVEGQTLDEWARSRGGKLAPEESLALIEQVASVLDAAHAQGVVHRDLKPSNIMLTDGGSTVKLLDLGIAKINSPAEGGTVLTRSGQFLGTPYYMAPEQWGEMPRDRREEIDSRADIYSLGVVVYEITAGTLPFAHSTLIALRYAHCKEAARPLEEIAAHVPEGWSRAVHRAMSKDRGDRQATAGEFARELRASLGTNAPSSNAFQTYDARASAPTIKGSVIETSPAGLGVTEEGLTASETRGLAASALPQIDADAKVPVPKRSWTLGLMTSRGCQVSLTVAAVAVFAVMAGGFALWSNLFSRSGSDTQATRSPATATNRNTRPSVAAGRPANSNAAESANAAPNASGEAFLSYYLLISPSVMSEQKRVAGDEAVPPAQSLQFVFTPRESGYLYMIGHDSQKNLVVMPLGDLVGVVEVKAGEEKPAPALARIKLDDAPSTETFTVIFSKEALGLGFASETLPLDGSFRKLTAEERSQIEELKKGSPPVSTSFSGGGNDKTARVVIPLSVGAESNLEKPIVFDIKLKLQRQ